MGKKKVSSQTGEEAIKEGAKVEEAALRAGAKIAAASGKVQEGRAYIHASYNNTTVSLTDTKGNLLSWSSAGSLGFSGPKKATPFAASKVVSVLAEKARKAGPVSLTVYVSGVGGGRDSAIRSLANQGFQIIAIKDVTPIPHNGPRPKKPRRI